MRTLTHYKKHDLRESISRLVHDSRFWAVVGLLLFILAFTAFVIWAAQSGSLQGTEPRGYPYAPYGPYPFPMQFGGGL